MDCALWPTFGRPSRSLIFSQPIVSTGASKSDLILRMFTNCSFQFGGLQTLSATWKKGIWCHQCSSAISINHQYGYEWSKIWTMQGFWASWFDDVTQKYSAQPCSNVFHLSSPSKDVSQTLGRAAMLSSYSILMCFSFLTLPETGGDRTSATGSSCTAVGSCFISTGFDDTFSCLILKWRFKYEFLISLQLIFSTKWGQTRFVIE